MNRVCILGGNRMRLAHRECVEHYNSTIACGAEHGECYNPRCALSPNYTGEPTSEEARACAVTYLKEHP